MRFLLAERRLRVRHGRLAVAVVGTAAVVGGVAASLGAGYAVSHAVLGDGSAYVAKGTAVAHVNGVAGKVDAETARSFATDRQPLSVVTLPSGKVAVVNQQTGKVSVLDGGTMKPVATGKAAPAARVVAAGRASWLEDPQHHTVALIGAGGQIGRSVDVGAPIADIAPDADGGLAVLTTDGTVVRVGTDLATRRLPISGGRGGALTVASGHAYLITTSGAVVQVDATQPRTATDQPAASAGPGTVAGSVLGSGAHVLVVARGTLLIIDPDGGATQRLDLSAGSAKLGQPVEFSGRVYVPDYTHHRLLVATEQPLGLADPIAVPGTDSTFALFVSGNRVWANDQYSQRMLEIDADGTWTKIDKGTGDGVVDDEHPPAPNPAKHAKPRHGTAPTVPRQGPPSVPRPGIPTGPTGPAVPSRPSSPPITPATPPHRAPPPLITVPRFPAGTNFADACAQLRAAQLNCSAVAIGPDAGSGNTGDVVRTNPSADRKVPSGTVVVVEYVGQVVVPNDLVRQSPDAACAELAKVPLSCVLSPDHTPVADPNAFGAVSGADPAPGTPIDKHAKVTITYPDRFTMPDLSGKSGADACLALNAFQLTVNGKTSKPTCSAVQGTAPPTVDRANQVYTQTPTAGSAAAAGAMFSVTYYKGNVSIPSWVGQDAQTALAQCNTLAAAPCTLAVGDSAGNHPQDAGKVERQDPAPATYPSVTAITIWYWDSNGTVPDLTNQSVAGGAGSQACQTLASLGFQCATNAVQGVPGQAANVVLSQSASGPQPLGTVITVNYTPAAAQMLYISTVNGVTTVSLDPSVGPATGWYAYPAGSGVPGTQTVQVAACNGGAAVCDGHAGNKMYTRAPLSLLQQLDGAAWTYMAPAFDLVLPTACGPGVQLNRTWHFEDSPNNSDIITNGTHHHAIHTYDFGTAQPGGTTGGSDGHEVLGCPAP